MDRITRLILVEMVASNNFSFHPAASLNRNYCWVSGRRPYDFPMTVEQRVDRAFSFRSQLQFLISPGLRILDVFRRKIEKEHRISYGVNRLEFLEIRIPTVN